MLEPPTCDYSFYPQQSSLAAWAARAKERLRTKPNLIEGLPDAEIDRLIDQADRFAGSSMAGASRCLPSHNADRIVEETGMDLERAKEILRTIFNHPECV